MRDTETLISCCTHTPLTLLFIHSLIHTHTDSYTNSCPLTDTLNHSHIHSFTHSNTFTIHSFAYALTVSSTLMHSFFLPCVQSFEKKAEKHAQSPVLGSSLTLPGLI